MRANHELNRSGGDFRELVPPRRRGGRPGQQRDAKPRRLQQPRQRHEVLLRQNFGRRHERHLLAILHRHQRGEQGDDRLARSDVALQEPVHRLRPLQVFDNLLEGLSLPRRQAERQHAPDRFADPIVDVCGDRFDFAGSKTAARDHSRLKQERLLEYQPALRQCVEPVQPGDGRVVRRKMSSQKRGVPRRESEPLGKVAGQRFRQIHGQPLKHLEHEPALHLRRHHPGALVHGHDAGGVDPLAVLLFEHLVLRVRELQRGRSPHLDDAVENHVLSAAQDVAQERLVQPRGSQRSAAVVNDRFEDLKPATPRRSHAGRQDPPADRGRPAWLQRPDGLQPAPVLVSERKAVQQVFNRDQADSFEIGGTARSDTFDKLKGGGEEGFRLVRPRRVRNRVEPPACHCTIMAWPRSTWISRMRAGSENGSSILNPDGFCALRE